LNSAGIELIRYFPVDAPNSLGQYADGR